VELPFKLKTPVDQKGEPFWDGKCFVMESQKTAVLEYSENLAGWSDALTDLHESTIGDSHPIDIISRATAIKELKKRDLPPGALILEVGCSSGFLLRELVKEFPSHLMVGVDVVKEPLYRLSKSLPGIPLFRFDLLKCPLPEKIADVIILLNVLEHIESDGEALKEVFNLLKPGGTLILEVPAGPFLYDSYDKELFHFRRYSSSVLADMLNKVGFEIKRKSHLGFLIYPPFILVKLLNRIFGSKNNADVRERALRTSENSLIKKALEFEEKFLSNKLLPFGVRVTMTATRPI